MSEFEIEVVSVVILLSLYLLCKTIGMSVRDGLKKRRDHDDSA